MKEERIRKALEDRAKWAVEVADTYFGSHEATARFAAELLRQASIASLSPSSFMTEEWCLRMAEREASIESP